MTANLLALAMALTVAVRCVCVLNILQHQPGRAYYQFIGFGVSYVTLAITAVGAALHIVEGHGEWPLWGFLIASVGLIAFDRRAADCFKPDRICDPVVCERKD